MMMTSTWQKQDQERKTPTHFVAIPVSDTTDTGIHSRVQTVQKTVVSHDKTLKPALIPVETLHLTLLAIHLNLENEEREIEKADKILQQCRTKILKDVLPSGAFTLKFKGLDFRFPKNKQPWLRYVKPFGEEGIQKLEKVYDEVRKTFTEGGFPPTDPDGEFYPHVTVINLNNDRDFFEKKGISKIPEESFSTCGALDLDFGEEQKWNNIQRLLMLDDGAMSGKCLDVDPGTKMLVIQHCDSTKESQHWTYHINSPAQ